MCCVYHEEWLIKKLAKDYATKGNTQLESVLPLYPSALPIKKPRKTRSDKGVKRGPRK